MMRKVSLWFSVVVFIVFPHITFSAYTSLFKTKDYDIAISVRCPEGNVSCDNVVSIVTDKKNYISLVMKGKTLNRDCKIGSCDFYGYEFKNKEMTYTIYQYGKLKISKKGKVILSEDGSFKEEIRLNGH
ncbi:hypothetical protein [Xenorhabdus miraniensis]|uniref:Uncharacterized protein n=1 Tax=Xenorhabdus miraniensis TaxID=351674 RepID=A0A2D0JKK1_9GAMM|nr:hypothetical protein [Xenorhabdus miraniensis]PHM46774.1 hypothetical protein Xmir_03893 [Xenorhabdus miraniensis]